MQLRIRVRAIGCVRRSGVCQGYSIIKNDAYAINDEVRYLKGKLLDQGRAPAFGDFLPTYNNPAAGAAAF